MTTTDDALRQKAEELARGKGTLSAEDLGGLSPEAARQTLHELRVHQIELEIQNEELRRSQTELDAARARYFDLYDLAPAGYCTLSEEGLILEANLTAATLLGVARGALVRRPISRFILEADQGIYYRLRKQLSETHSASSLLRQDASAVAQGAMAGQAGGQAGQAGTPQACELRMVKKDGTQFWVHLEATTAQDGDGAFPVSRCVLSDITGRKQAEEALQQAHDELEQRVAERTEDLREANEALLAEITDRRRAEAEREKLDAVNRQLQKSESLGRMAGAIAHHFNNQLQVVTGNLEVALGERPEGGHVLESLTEALRATRGASELSSLMLTYLGQAITTREPLDLGEVCRRGLPLLRAAMPKNVVLESDVPSPGPVVRANANQIQQVLTNLVTNAWEAVGNGQAAIHLTVTTVAPADIPTSHRFPIDGQTRNHAHACLEVADTGCGIAAHDIERLFDPFFSSKFTGRGMGLPVIRGIVRAHEGAITVESTPGNGSVFRVYLPLTEEELPLRPEKAAGASDIQGSGTVLLVDDEDTVRSVAAATLTRLGYTVIAAKDGVEAVEVFRLHADDIRCVVCDLTMPRMNGWETLTALRHIAPGIPVILASGYTEAHVMDGAHPERPQAYLSKPYGREQLREAIRLALAHQHDR